MKHGQIVCKKCKLPVYAKDLCKRCYLSSYYKKFYWTHRKEIAERSEQKRWGPLGMPTPFLVRNEISSDGCNFETARVISSFRSSRKRKLILYYLKKEMGYKLQIIQEGTEAWWKFDNLEEADLFLKRIKNVTFEYLTK